MKMVNLIRKILYLKLLPELPDLNAYAIEKRPEKQVKIGKEASAKGTVINGREWTSEWRADGTGFTSEATGTAPSTPDLVQLDQYDTAYLNELLPDWKRDETRAKVIKWHWLRQESAATIDSQHRTKDGKVQKGYSERAVADYIKVFYAADERREQDKKTRQRAGNGVNTVEWD